MFLLESQLEEEFDRSDEEFPTTEHEGHRSFFFVISPSDNHENTTRYFLHVFFNNVEKDKTSTDVYLTVFI